MGRRHGKSTVGQAVGLSVASRGGRVAWCVPNYKNGAALWRMCEMVAAPLQPYVTIRRTERTLTFPNGGFLGVYSLENEDSIRGESFHLAIIDEAARCNESAWNEVIMPTLADVDGDALIISTPKGKNWFYNLFMIGLSDGVQYASFTAPSSDNPIPSIQRAVALMEARYGRDYPAFRQEWLAEFIEDGGEVFRRVRSQATATPQAFALPGDVYSMGIDWGYTTDYTVITILDVTTSEIVAIDRFTGVGFEEQIARVETFYQRFRPAIVTPEQNSATVLCQMLLNRGIPARPFVTSNTTKSVIIQGLALGLEREQLRIIPNPILIAELEAYTSKMLPSGLMRYNAPSGMHDDTVMSTALAWFGRYSSYIGVMFA